MGAPQVVDAHVHFWEPARLHYPWLDDVPALRRDFLPAHYPPFGDGSVDAAIFVEANAAPAEHLAEVAFVERLAAAEPRIAAIVAYVDLLDEPRRDAALERLAATQNVAGVRHNIQGQPASVCHDERFVRGVQELGGAGLTFDLCATADQLAEVAELVRRCPGTQFVLDHCGKPAIRDDAFASWAADVARIATLGNVWCKLSGLLTEARAEQRHLEPLRPYMEHVVASFGAGRVMYGSDWPVVTLAGGVAPWRAIVDQFTATWSGADRHRLYADNAFRFYGLSLHVDS